MQWSCALKAMTKSTLIKLKTILHIVASPFSMLLSMRDFEFLSDEETLKYLYKSGKGLVRYGSGENGYLSGYSRPHQKYDKGLERKLRNIMKQYKKNLSANSYVIAFPLDVTYEECYRDRKLNPGVWKGVPRYAPLPLLKKSCTYASPFCFRLENAIFKNKKNYIMSIKKLFEGKDIIYVGPENETSDYFNPKSFLRIPEKDVYDEYDFLKNRVMEEVEKYNNPLVLITAGITATAMSAELNDEGILTYDVGSILRW